MFARFPLLDPEIFLKRIMPLIKLLVSPLGAIVWLAVVIAARKWWSSILTRPLTSSRASSRFLSEFRSRIAAPAIAHGGVVEKYIGDAIMVVFGAPKSRADDARRALQCATEMADAIVVWSSDRERQGKVPVMVGIGAHYGTAFAGVLSDGRMLEYTVIGDTVNVASRLADIPHSDKTELLVSAELADAAGGLPGDGRFRAMPPQSVPGHPRLLSVFQRR